MAEEGLIIDELEKTTDRELFSATSYRRFSCYQALLEIHPEGSFTVDGCMSKMLIYIATWLREKIQAEDEVWPDGLRTIPGIEEWEKLSVDENSPISKIDVKEPARIRTLYWDNCWTIRFNEVVSGFPGEFINNISLTKEQNSVVLAINTECRQSMEEKNKAIAMRPGYVSKIMFDKDMYITEKLSDGALGIKLSEEPVAVNGKGSEAEGLYQLISDPMRNMPILIIPEPDNEAEKNTAESIYHNVRNGIDHHGVFGYYSSVYISGGWNKFIHSLKVKETEKIRQWISDVVSDGRAVLIAPWDGKEDSFRYYDWDTDPGDYVLWNEDASVEDCPKFDEEYSERLKELKFSQEPIDRECNFGSYRFNRTLWNEWNQSRINEETENQDYDEIIKDLNIRVSEFEKDNKDLKEKITNLEGLNSELRAEKQRLKKGIDKIDKDKNSGKTEEKTAGIPGRRSDKRLENIKKRIEDEAGDKKPLFECEGSFKPIVGALRRDLLNRVYKGFFSLITARPEVENPTRREDVLGIVYVYNDPANGYVDNNDEEAILYYPASMELYEGEFQRLVLDSIWDEEDGLINQVAKDIGYDKKWRENLKRDMLDKINNYRDVSKIRPALKGIGLRKDEHNKHEKWKLYDDDRYTLAIATTPGDVNTGKNTVDQILEAMF